MFVEEWRDSEEFEHYEQEIEIANMNPEDYLSEPEAISKSQVPSPCYSPPPPDDGGDPYGGCSADMFYDKPGDSGDECTPQPHTGPRVRVTLRVRYGRSVEVKLRLPKIDYENDYEQMCEHELARQERIASITGRPWHEAREGAVLPWHWTDDLGRDSSVWRFETVTRVERVQKREPPPLRDDPAYGPRACNPNGDESFRADRMAWFERVTGESMEGCDLTQQWQRADRVARAFRADTRVSRKRWDFYCDDV